MRFVNKNTIRLDKEINELDKFVYKFIDILKRYADYVIISGYVSILLGRSRATEDVDVFMQEIDENLFRKFYEELKVEGFWCLNSEDAEDIYKYLDTGLAVRFALENTTVPNFEIKFAKKPLDKESFNDRITTITDLGGVFISDLERQIAFKRYYLKSDKDIEDAKHIEEAFRDYINKEKLDKYKRSLLQKNEIPKARKKQ